MPIKEPDFNWDVETLLGEVDCPCCGSEIWVEIRGHGFWCEQCNTQISDIRPPGGDSGYIVEFSTDATWTNKAKRIPEADNLKMSAKFLGTLTPELYWFSVWDEPEEGKAKELDFEPVGEKLTP